MLLLRWSAATQKINSVFPHDVIVFFSSSNTFVKDSVRHKVYILLVCLNWKEIEKIVVSFFVLWCVLNEV